jgi:serine phosphatase RsbU (regulator of sigma subunit)/CHASE3 domain sensor protein
MRDPDRRDVWSVLTGRGTPSLRGLLTRAVLGVGLVLAILMALAIVGMMGATSSYRDDQQVAVERALASEAILANFLNASSSARGYTLTGNRAYLVPYEQAEDSYPRNIRRLRGLVAGTPELEDAVDSINRAAVLWFEEARLLIDTRADGDITGAVARVAEGIDKARLDALRAEHADLRDLVERERQVALGRADERRLLTVVALVGGALLAMLTVLGATRLLWRRVGNPLGALAQGVRRVAGGDVGTSVPPPDDAAREVVQLVSAFNDMQGQVTLQREAAASSARRSEAARAERRLWQTVEQGLLPENLPAAPGLRLAARYLPSSPGLAIGGDFYDARLLPDGRLVVMVGDVAGHGAESAARAARMRFGWSALVEVDPDPQRVLTIMNTHISEPHERDQGIFATMCHCIVHPDGRAQFALAGHPRPLLVAGDKALPVDVEARGPILGLLDDVEWPVTEVYIPMGAMLVIYTDGLVEARRGGDIFGWQRAAAVLTDSSGRALEERIAGLTEAARRYDEGQLRDDVAVLAVQRVPSDPRARTGPASRRGR